MSSRLGIGISSLFSRISRCRKLAMVTNGSLAMSVRRHSEIPPQPFSNMPFKIKTPFAATLFFAIFFGLGLWAPFIIVWYSMAKKTM